jgi:hypothetical protein
MEQNVIQRNMWNTAGKAGLILGSVSTAYLFLTQWLIMAEMPAILVMLINSLLWVTKFGGCLFLMVMFMKRFASENPEADSNVIFRTGSAIAFLSALVYAGFSFANLSYFYPDFYAEMMDTIMQQFASILDSNTLAEMEKYKHNQPQMTFFSNLIYCFVYGTVLSRIITRLISGQTRSSGYKPEEQ